MKVVNLQGGTDILMIYIKPNLILFGGLLKDKNKVSNDLWILNMETVINKENGKVYQWYNVEYDKEAVYPPPRIYHSMVVCRSGKAKGMIIVFGGER